MAALQDAMLEIKIHVRRQNLVENKLPVDFIYTSIHKEFHVIDYYLSLQKGLLLHED